MALRRAGGAECTERGLEALDGLSVRPVGYRAPRWEMNWHSADLLIQRGFLYDSSLLDGDVPYRCCGESGRGSLVEIPVDWTLDDWEQHAFYPGWTGSGVIESPTKVHEMWLLEAQAHHVEGGCVVLTNHPFISGRPSKSAALERLIEDVRALDGMWVATFGEIAEHAKSRVRRTEDPPDRLSRRLLRPHGDAEGGHDSAH